MEGKPLKKSSSPLLLTGRWPATRSIGLFVLLISYWVVFKYIDPVGLESATKSASAQFFSAITEPFYGYGSHGRSQSHTAVVEISDDSLKYFEETWPVSYHRHAYLLKQILDAQPAAVLVDIYFNGERQNDDLHAFDGVLAQAKQMHVPIFFVHGIPGDPTDQSNGNLPEPLTPYQVYSGWRGEKEGMYPLHVEVPGKKEGTLPTAAFAMFSALCQDRWQALCHMDEELEEPAFVRWGVYVDPAQKQIFDSSGGCKDATAGGAARLWRAVVTGFHALNGRWVPPRDNVCFYQLTMDAALLDKMSLHTKAPYTDVLRGRAVFYGGDLAAMHDVLNAPAIGQVPGVQLHAMAFDNLLTYGKQYFHEAPELKNPFLPLDEAEAMELFLWVVLSIGMSIRHYHVITKKTSRTTLLHSDSNNLQKEIQESHWRPILYYIKLGVGAIFCAGCCIFDLLSRHIFSPVIIALYGFLFVLIIFMPMEFETPTYMSKLRQVLCISAIAFCANELFFHWPNTDWIGLALLWFTVPEVNEENSPVQTLANFSAACWHHVLQGRKRAGKLFGFKYDQE